MAEAQKKHRLYIVGGKSKNIPDWLSEAFDYEQFDQENSKTRTLEPEHTPDAVVCLKSWVGHEHWYGARDLAARLGVPFINTAGGWSGSLKAAADLGVEWFIQDIERAKSESPHEEEIVEFIDNAWREAYEREYKARSSLEKHFGKERRKYDEAKAQLEHMRVKEAAAQRVIVEIRAAAARQREAMTEVEARSARVAEALVEHMRTLQTLIDVTDEGHQSLLRASARIGDASRGAQSRLDALRSAMAIAEDGLATIRQVDRTNRATKSVSASNAESDS
jgi:hypothetical protein